MIITQFGFAWVWTLNEKEHVYKKVGHILGEGPMTFPFLFLNHNTTAKTKLLRQLSV